MARIFICYRRDDSSGHAGRLRDALSARFGSHEIFRDIETIAPGDDFVVAVSRAMASCQLCLVIIGARWLETTRGARRLDDPQDHVRREVAAALGSGVRVIPVLVQGASMPRPDELPEEIRTLANRNGITLDDEGWDSDVERLAAAIRRSLTDTPTAPGGQVQERSVASATAPADRPEGGHFGLDGRRMLAVVGGGIVLLALIAILLRDRSGNGVPADGGPTASSDALAGASTTNEPIATDKPAPTGPETQVTLPMGGEAAIGEIVYEILEAGIRPHAGGSTLALQMRVRNLARYDALFSDGEFRLALGGEEKAPTSGLGKIVPGESSQDGTVTFELPPGAASGRLRITNAGEKGEVALDLSGGSGPTASQDREARRSGKTTFTVPVNPAAAEMRFGDLVCQIRTAGVRRYANKLKLTLSFRAQNQGSYDTYMGDGYFRLVRGDIVQAPVSGLFLVVPGSAARDGDIVFDLPLDATDVIVRVRVGDLTAEMPLRIAAGPS